MTQSSSLSLGEFLRQEREKRALTIEQVASATKINIRLLHALEADHYVDLPAVPFIRGFVSSYVRFLGLDANEVISRFDGFIEGKAQERPNREAGLSGYAFEKREGEQSRTALWVVMAVFLVLGGIFIVFLKPHFKHRNESHAEKLRGAHSHASPSPSPSPLPSPSPSPSPSSSTVPLSEPSVAAAPSPSPSPLPKPSPSVVIMPAVIQSPVPVALSPSPSPVPTPSPTVKGPLPLTPDPKDPLASGRDLKANEIKHKIVFRALSDVWVRYQIDRRAIMKFILRQDRVLVLRATDVIHFQTSNPEALTYSWNAKAYLPLSKKGPAQKIITFPSQENSNPFTDEKPLPMAVPAAPKMEENQDVPSPSETSQKPPSAEE